MTDHDKEVLQPHPAMGYISVETPPMDELVRETITEKEVDEMLAKIKLHVEQTAAIIPKGVSFFDLMTGTAVGASTDIPNKMELAKIMQDKACTFQTGIVREIGPMPGVDIEFEAGSRVYWHEGKGHKIGKITLVSFDMIICWD